MTKDTNKDDIVYVSKEFNPNPRYQPQFDDPQKAIDYLVNQENALKVIRYIQETVEGLKELSNGCEVEIASCPDGCCGIDTWVIDSAMQIQAMTISHQVFKDKFYITEIIGHEVQLNHLLLAIRPLCMMTQLNVDVISYLKLCSYKDTGGVQEFEYFFTQSVEENLNSNEELRNYLLTLFKL